MQREFINHNLFINGLDEFKSNDPHLFSLKGLKFVHPLDWWAAIRWDEPGIYILTGGRQIGKTTSTKLLIKYVLEQNIFPPTAIFYLPCDQIDSHHHLSQTIRLFVDGLNRGQNFLLIVDEVTYVKDWDRSIKALADEGLFRNGHLILTGSDSVILKEAASRFPGRRGDAYKVDFHIYPLNFFEYIKLTNNSLLENSEKNIGALFDAFDVYLKCGGFLRAINEIHSLGKIQEATYLTFEQWIKGDFGRKNKNEHTLLLILKTLFETAGTQVTYSSLTNSMGHVSKETFIDYVNILIRMDVIFELQAFDQNTKLGFPKKAKKIHFSAPFIMDTIGRWLEKERLIKRVSDEPMKVEAVVAANFHRHFPSYYIKADGEIDLVVVEGENFLPIEVKWTNNLRANDLKQLKKYKHSIVLTKSKYEGNIEGIKAWPLPMFLIKSLITGQISPVIKPFHQT